MSKWSQTALALLKRVPPGVWQGSSAGGSSLGLLMAVAATTSLGELGTGRSSIMPSSKGLLGGLFRIGRGLGLRGDNTSS